MEKRAQEGDKKAVFLLSLINNPVSFVNAIPLIVMASGVCFGAFIVPWATETFHPYIKPVSYTHLDVYKSPHSYRYLAEPWFHQFLYPLLPALQSVLPLSSAHFPVFSSEPVPLSAAAR